MSTLTTIREASGRVRRTVDRRGPYRRLIAASPFLERDPYGRRQLEGLGILPILPIAAGLVKNVPVIGAIGKAIMGSTRPESDIWKQYTGMAGRQAGHELDNQFRNEAFVGLFRLGRNTFPPRQKKYGSTGDKQFLQDMVNEIANAFRSKRLTLAEAQAPIIFDKVVLPWTAQMGDWNAPPGNWKNWDRQILIDQIDAWLYDQPIIATSYTTSTWASPRSTELAKELQPQASAPAPAPVSGAPAPAPQTGANAPITAPVATVTSQPVSVAVQPVASATTPSSTDALIKQMLDAGASQQQAYLAALQSLQAQGAPITPAVQQAVAQDVKEASAGGTLPPWASYAAIGAGALLLFFTMARPAKRGRA